MIFSFLVNRMGGYNGLRSRYASASSGLRKRYYQRLLRGFQHETGSYIPFHTEIDGPMNLLHGPYGIFISGGAKVGKNCTIFQQVTIGSNMLVDSKGLGSPTIGDNCLIGAGAKIIGNVTVGDNCRIGANAVVTTDVPPHSVVVMGSTTVIQKESLENRIYQLSDQGWGYQAAGEFVLEKDKEVIRQLGGE